MRFRKLLLVISIIIVSMFALMLTTSYAWYSFGGTTFDAVTSAEDIEVTYQSGEYISNNAAVPINSDEIEKYSDKGNFNVKVNSNKEDVMISVKLTDITIDSVLINSNLKIELYYQGTKVSIVDGSGIVSGEDLFVGNVVLEDISSNQFEVRMYILDDNSNQNTMMDKSFKAKIKVDAISRLNPEFTDFTNADIYVDSITIDGEESKYIPTEGYYSMNATCTKGSSLSWEPLSKTITYDTGSYVQDVCSLAFASSTEYPLLNTMEVGSYVKYVGKGGKVGTNSVSCQIGGKASSAVTTDETEAPNSCLGQNARNDLETSNSVYGYCLNSNTKYYVAGWRIAYIDSNSNPVIVSAGAPECVYKVNSTGNVEYIKKANSVAMKYCNSDLVDGNCSCVDSNGDGYCDCTDSDSDGLCDEIENGEVDAWAINDNDFYNITKAVNGYGKRLTGNSSSLGDTGGILGSTLYCNGYHSNGDCGYNNDLIDIGGRYWFAARLSASNIAGPLWVADERYVNSWGDEYSLGLRPVISLSSTVVVTGGSGTMDDPYVISNQS